jgi:hypothetical protein
VRFGWKAELAGRKMKCKKCGRSVTVPDPSNASLSSLLDEELPDAGPSLSARPKTESAANDPSELGRSLTMSNSAAASNPGRLRIQWGKYFACYLWEPVFTLIAGGIGIVVAVVFGKGQVAPMVAITIGVVAVLGMVGWQLLQRYEHFRHGCVCPAMVIATKPYLIAVASDLTTTEGASYPAIKIMKQPLGKMTGGPPEIGMRLATVATYRGDPNSAHWSDFEPLAVNCVTADEQAIARVFNSITQEEWDDLDHGVQQIPKRPKSGNLIMVR